ncbi:hypothetical protein JTE90_015001 [Oedothorax gibbosus]|uniref:Uncharacterized protein n=1 Tax=Oedothorax gibbosus TaxID=931172 RepID=A0AAV6TV59_9ARAC|nr:hypothetical protein JTE90_015001 [Oedothorax gibbosus]
MAYTTEVDVIATASYFQHQDVIQPYRLVFTVVRDPDQHYIVEPSKESLEFIKHQTLSTLFPKLVLRCDPKKGRGEVERCALSCASHMQLDGKAQSLDMYRKDSKKKNCLLSPSKLGFHVCVPRIRFSPFRYFYKFGSHSSLEDWILSTWCQQFWMTTERLWTHISYFG